MKKFALAVRKVSEGGSGGSGDEGLASPKKGDKGKKPTELDAAEPKGASFADVICFKSNSLQFLFLLFRF